MAQSCTLCNTVSMDPASYQNHIEGKRHIHAMQRHEFFKKTNENTVVVSLQPKLSSDDNYLRFFKQYGKIKRHLFHEDVLIIEYFNSDIVRDIVSKPVIFYQKEIDVRKKSQDPKYSKFNLRPQIIKDNEVSESIIDYKNIKERIKKEHTFDKQLNAFLLAVKLTNEEIKNYYITTCTEVGNILKSIFPTSSIYYFGSTVTGLGFKECDLDLYLDIGVPITEIPSERAWTMNQIIKGTRRLMYRMPSSFQNVIPIPKAKVPIIKFTYVPTNISCDISFKNGLGYYNSKLIKHCLMQDNRLTPLIAIIKYWARTCNITCRGKMSNYTLVLLVIFYLQQPNVGIIPPLMYFQANCMPLTINGWQINFDDSLRIYNQNVKSIPELLDGFFNFYLNFNFNSFVICTLDGNIHQKKDFEQVENLPSCMLRYKASVKSGDVFTKLDVNKPICVQDPIELRHNVASGNTIKSLGIFQKYLSASAKVCASAAARNYSNLIISLFDIVLPNQNDNLYDDTIVELTKQYSLTVPSDIERLNETAKTEYAIEYWYFTVFSIVLDILKKVYKMELQIVFDEQSVEEEITGPLLFHRVKVCQKISLHCTSAQFVWMKRKKQMIPRDENLSPIEYEAMVTDKLIEINKEENDKKCPKVEFICALQKKRYPTHVAISLSDKKSDKNWYKPFATNFKTRIRPLIETTLIHIKKHNKCS